MVALNTHIYWELHELGFGLCVKQKDGKNVKVWQDGEKEIEERADGWDAWQLGKENLLTNPEMYNFLEKKIQERRRR